jgi:hypothetical protein
MKIILRLILLKLSSLTLFKQKKEKEKKNYFYDMYSFWCNKTMSFLKLRHIEFNNVYVKGKL